MSRVPRGEAGLASALLNTGQQIGGSLGLAVLVTVATSVTKSHLVSAGHTISRAQHALATTNGYDAAFRIGSLIAFVAFILAVTVIRGTTPVPAAVSNVSAGAEPEAAVA